MRRWSLGACVCLVMGVCSLKEACFTASDPSTCVPSGSHIVFMGDSVTRYQYLSLAYLLHFGSPIHEDERRGLGPGAKHPLLESTWESWDEFFDSTTLELAPHEICDCYRARHWKSTNGSMIKTFENRYYHDPESNVTASFLSVFGLFPLTGRLWPSAAAPPATNQAHMINFGRRRGPTLYHNRTLSKSFVRANWKSEWVDTFESLVPNLPGRPPTALVLNSGHWGAMGFKHVHLLQAVRSRASPRVDELRPERTGDSASPFFSLALRRS